MTVKAKAAPWDIDCSKDEPLVKQEFVDECDINKIIAKCLRNGTEISHVARVAPVFADVSSAGDYGEAMRRVKAAESAFMELPAVVRRRFDNDPVLLMSFLSDDKNRVEAEELGLVVKKAPAPAPVVPPAAVPPVVPPAK